MPVGLRLVGRSVLATDGQHPRPTPAAYSASSQVDLLSDGGEVEAQVLHGDDGVGGKGGVMGKSVGKPMPDESFDLSVGSCPRRGDGGAMRQRRAGGQEVVRAFHYEHGVSDGSLHRAIARSALTLRRPLCHGRRERRRVGQTSAPIRPFVVGKLRADLTALHFTGPRSRGFKMALLYRTASIRSLTRD